MLYTSIDVCDEQNRRENHISNAIHFILYNFAFKKENRAKL